MADLVERLLDPDMSAQELRLHMGELSAQEVRTARAAIRWANTRLRAALEAEASKGERRGLERAADLRSAIAAAVCGFVAKGWDRREEPIRILEQALADDRRRALMPESPVREGE